MRMRKTPLEKAIDAITDRRRRHDARQRAEGMTRVTLAVPADRVDDVKRYAARLRRQSQEDTR
jgi:hypothetical protein